MNSSILPLFVVSAVLPIADCEQLLTAACLVAAGQLPARLALKAEGVGVSLLDLCWREMV